MEKLETHKLLLISLKWVVKLVIWLFGWRHITAVSGYISPP